jgi:predicted XRE-type DNA-binding protein
MKKKKEIETDYVVGSGNVFADLGFENPEEELLKARLAALVNRSIEARRWTQRHAANVLSIKQPDVSDLTRGRLEHFSV